MKILVGRIVKPQGVKGEVKVECFLDTSLLLKDIDGLYVGVEKRKIELFRADGRFFFVKFFGVNDRNSAELLKDWEVFAEKADIPLSENSFFVQDLLSCRVFLDDGQFVGEVCDISQFGSADVYTCKKDGKEISFPWLKDLILTVSVETKRIILKKMRFLEVAVGFDDD